MAAAAPVVARQTSRFVVRGSAVIFTFFVGKY